MWSVLVVSALKATAWLSAAKGQSTEKAWGSPSHHRKYLTDRKIPSGEGSLQKSGGNLSPVLMVEWPPLSEGILFFYMMSPLHLQMGWFVPLFSIWKCSFLMMKSWQLHLVSTPYAMRMNLWSHHLTVSPKCTRKREASCFSRMGKLWDLLVHRRCFHFCIITKSITEQL